MFALYRSGRAFAHRAAFRHAHSHRHRLTEAKMQDSRTNQLVRSMYAIFQSKDRAAMEALLDDKFHFSSPRDNRISKREYFERCWPNSDKLTGFELEKVFSEGNEAFVRYTAQRVADGVRFRNTEFIRVEGGKIVEVEVYFGRDL
jgi:ketosteroid isomerase-like protein